MLSVGLSVRAKRPSAAKMRAGQERLAALDWAVYVRIHAAALHVKLAAS